MNDHCSLSVAPQPSLVLCNVADDGFEIPYRTLRDKIVIRDNRPDPSGISARRMSNRLTVAVGCCTMMDDLSVERVRFTRQVDTTGGDAKSEDGTRTVSCPYIPPLF